MKFLKRVYIGNKMPDYTSSKLQISFNPHEKRSILKEGKKLIEPIIKPKKHLLSIDTNN